jgi:putative ABC transport system substrate-binding protein
MERFFGRRAQQDGLGERKAMINPQHPLPVVRQCELLNLARSTAYYRLLPMSEADLTLMRRVDGRIASEVAVSWCTQVARSAQPGWFRRKPERARTIFADLVIREVNVIVLGTGRWLQDAALAATRAIPLLTVFDEDPVAAGLISSLARPGGNLTGVSRTSSPEYFLKQLQLLLQIVPNIKRVALIATRDVVRKYTNMPDIARVAVVSTPVEFVEDFEQAFMTIRSKGVEGIVASGNAVNYVNVHRTADFAIDNRLPTMFGFREGSDSGGLISFGTDGQATYRQIARQVAKIPGGSKDRRHSRRAANDVRTRDQPQDGQGAWPHDSERTTSARRRGDSIVSTRVSASGRYC